MPSAECGRKLANLQLGNVYMCASQVMQNQNAPLYVHKISASCNIGGIEVCIQYLRNVYLVVRMITMAVGVEQNAMINIVRSARGVL